MNAKIQFPNKKIIIFASGNGSNAVNIIRYFAERNEVSVTHVFSNNKKAKVLKSAYDLEISALHFDRSAFYHTNEVLNILKDTDPDLIVLAGFLWKIPEKIIQTFAGKIINIHPALLPKYGGKGMYGNYVHQAVIDNHEKKSGITIHYVNEQYDEGKIIAQFETNITPDDTVNALTDKIKKLEHTHFPKVIDKLLFAEED